MILKQKRNFEALIADTFGYVKEYAAHFFPTMLRVNAFYLILMCVMAYFAFTLSYPDINGISGLKINMNPGGFGFKDIMPSLNIANRQLSGMPWAIPLLMVGYLFLMAGFVVFMAFTPSYMILQEKNGREPSFGEIVSFLKHRAGKLILYCLGILLMSIPVLVILIPTIIFLAISIVGIILIPLVFLFIMLMSSLMLYAYISDERTGFFESMDIAWRIIRRSFWKTMIANGLIYIVTAALAWFPRSFASAFENINTPGLVFLGVLFAFFALLLHFVISAFYNVNVGLIYFSSEMDRKGFS